MHREIAPGVYYVGVDDHHTHLFEGLWELPFGVSYNSYLVVDEKVALVECVKGAWDDEWLDNIREVVDPAEIDYIVLNHMEPDHTGALPRIAEIARDATLVYTPRAAPMQRAFYDVGLKERTVDDLEEISLGSKTLRFIHAQFLHWPETMFTYLVEDGVLFTCDAFGAFGALNGRLFDDEADLERVEAESRRYVSAIITSYLKFVQRGIKKVQDLGIDIRVIAPSHGPVYRKDPMWIVKKYLEWSSPELEKRVVIAYGSMYGFTQRTAMLLKRELEALGVSVTAHNLSYSEPSHVITDAVRAGVLVLGTPTYDAFPFPKVWAFANEIVGKRFPKRPIGLFGTYGWGGGGVKKLRKQLEDARYEILEPVVRVHGRLTDEEIGACRQLAREIAARLR